MSSKFIKRWEERDGNIIKAAIRPTPSLKSKIRKASSRIETQMNQLDNALDRMSERDKRLFSKIVEAQTRNQTEKAGILANEVTELRKTAGFMLHSKLALERVGLRLKTVTEMGDVMATLSPAKEVVNNLRSGFARTLPSAEKELNELGALLDNIMVDAGTTMGMPKDFQVANMEAKKILEEAAIVSQEKMKGQFPEISAAESEPGLSYPE